jgi:hypothetical protein
MQVLGNDSSDLKSISAFQSIVVFFTCALHSFGSEKIISTAAGMCCWLVLEPSIKVTIEL